MPPIDRFVPRCAAEPPQELLPYGRWAEILAAEFHAACAEIDPDGEDLGEPGEIAWFPDRTYNGRTYVPATCPTSTGLELFGFVSFVHGGGNGEAHDFLALADFTAETAERNPDWQIDLCDDVIGTWRGEQGNVAQITLVWGAVLRGGGALVTGELADLAVDQCPLVERRFTLIAPDAYRGDELDVKLWDAKGGLVAVESLYVDDDGGDEEAGGTETGSL